MYVKNGRFRGNFFNNLPSAAMPLVTFLTKPSVHRQVLKKLRDIPYKIQTTNLKQRREVLNEIRDILSTPGNLGFKIFKYHKVTSFKALSKYHRLIKDILQVGIGCIGSSCIDPPPVSD